MAILRAGVKPPVWRNVDADVIDQPFGDKRLPFVRAVEQLAHGDGRGAILADLPEVGVIFGRKRIFHEEEPELLHVLAELDRLVRRDPLVHVVQQLDLFAQLLPADLHELQRAAAIYRRIEDRLIVQGLHRQPCPAREP